MSAKILDGKKLSQKILKALKKEIKKNESDHSVKLKLVVVQVGENPISEIFIRQKEKKAKEIGIDFKLYKFDRNIAFEKLKNEIRKIAKSPCNSGIVIQLPLSEKFDCQEILNLVPPEKDIDILSEKAKINFYFGDSKIQPPVLKAIVYLLKEYKINIKGKHIVVLGMGRLVGQPVISWLVREKASFSAKDRFFPNLSFFTKEADILISGIGKPEIIKAKMIKKGAVIIDIGASFIKGKIKGDVDFKSVFKKAGYFAAATGGIGPLTVAFLLKNLVELNKISQTLDRKIHKDNSFDI